MLEKLIEFLNKIILNLTERKNKIISPIIFGFISGLIVFIYGNVFSPSDDIASFGIDQVIYLIMAVMAYIPVHNAVEKNKINKIDKIQNASIAIRDDLLKERVYNSPDITPEDLSADSILVELTGIDPSIMSLKDLQAVVNYIRTLFPNSEEDELKEEPFVRGYKPCRGSKNTVVNKSYNL